MFKKITVLILLNACIFSNIALGADEVKKEISNLMPWKGKSVPISNIYNQDGGEIYFKKVTRYAPTGYTAEKVKEHILGNFSPRFKSMEVVDEHTIIIDDKIKGEYVHVGDLSTKVYIYNATWHIFKTDSKEMIDAGYKYFLFIPFEQHGKDGLRHAHLRYGNENFDFLSTDPSLYMWAPTIYQPSETDEAIIMKQMIKGAKLRGKSLPKLLK